MVEILLFVSFVVFTWVFVGFYSGFSRVFVMVCWNFSVVSLLVLSVCFLCWDAPRTLSDKR